MRLIVTSVFLVLMSLTPHLSAQAAAAADPLALTIAPQLWEFKKDGRHFYVLGSLHRVGARYFPQWVLDLIAQSSKIVFEINIDPKSKNPTGMALPEGQTLQSLLTPEAWSQLIAEVSPHLKPDELAEVQRLNPLGAFLFITETRRQLTADTSKENRPLARFVQEVSGAMDHDIMDLASARNIPIGELETVAQQLAALPMSVGELEKTIMESPEVWRESAEKYIRDLAALIFKFFDGDIAVVKMTTKELPKEAYEMMFRDRNMAWIPKLEELPDNSLVVMGAGHLMSREGLLALMHARGWQVQRIANCDHLLTSGS